MKRAVVLLFALSLVAAAKDRVSVQVLEGSSYNQPQTFTMPGSTGHSETNCNDYGSTVDCKTTTTAATPAHSFVRDVQQVNLRVMMPDGTGAVLWCQLKLRDCQNLIAGNYEAEIGKDTVWLYYSAYAESPKYSKDGVALPRKTKTDKIKYRITGTFTKELANYISDLRVKNQEAYELGNSLGFPDKEVTESLMKEGPETTLKFLRSKAHK